MAHKSPERALNGRPFTQTEAQVFWSLLSNMKRNAQNAEHSAFMLMSALGTTDQRDVVCGTGTGAAEFQRALRSELADMHRQMEALTLLAAQGVEALKKREGVAA